MNISLEATTSNEENSPIIVSGTIGREFESHRPDHFFLRNFIIFKHYRERVRPAEAKKWFGIEPDADGKVTVIPKADEEVVAVARGAAG